VWCHPAHADSDTKQAGALDGNPEDLRGKAENKAFTGSARTLSGAPSAAPVEAPGPGPLQPIVHTISFYRNGACVGMWLKPGQACALTLPLTWCLRHPQASW
jgi:hypothetical protein